MIKQTSVHEKNSSSTWNNLALVKVAFTFKKLASSLPLKVKPSYILHIVLTVQYAKCFVICKEYLSWNDEISKKKNKIREVIFQHGN